MEETWHWDGFVAGIGTSYK